MAGADEESVPPPHPLKVKASNEIPARIAIFLLFILLPPSYFMSAYENIIAPFEVFCNIFFVNIINVLNTTYERKTIYHNSVLI
ncbi:hypothetical protein JCM15765_35980 [Paradesulfitobacterium aromaticivorans]